MSRAPLSEGPERVDLRWVGGVAAPGHSLRAKRPAGSAPTGGPPALLAPLAVAATEGLVSYSYVLPRWPVNSLIRSRNVAVDRVLAEGHPI
jgi:hypothetical protein